MQDFISEFINYFIGFIVICAIFAPSLFHFSSTNHLIKGISNRDYLLYIDVIFAFIPYTISSVISNDFSWYGTWTFVKYGLIIAMLLSVILLVAYIGFLKEQPYTVFMIVLYFILLVIEITLFVHLHGLGFKPNYDPFSNLNKF